MVILAALCLAPVSDAYTEKVKPTVSWRAGSGKVEMALSSDGSTVATVDPETGSVTTWSTSTGKPIAKLGEDKGGKWPEVSPDGKFVVTFGKDRKLRIWKDSPDGKPISTLNPAREVPVYQFAAKGHVLVYTTATALSAYDLDTGKTTTSARYSFPEQFILQVDGRHGRVVIGDTSVEDSGLYIWDRAAGHKVVHAPLGRQVTRYAYPTTDRTLIYQGIGFNPKIGLSAQLYRYDVGTRKSTKIFSVETGRFILSFLYFEPGGRSVAAKFRPGESLEVLVRTPAEGVRSYMLATQNKRLLPTVDAAGRTLATVSDDGIVRVWQLLPPPIFSL